MKRICLAALLVAACFSYGQRPIKMKGILVRPAAKADFVTIWTRLIQGYRAGESSRNKLFDPVDTSENPQTIKSIRRNAAFYGNYVIYCKGLRPSSKYLKLGELTAAFFQHQEQLWNAYGGTVSSGSGPSKSKASTIVRKERKTGKLSNKRLRR